MWVGDGSLPAEQQGLTVLGAPLGSDAFGRHQLHAKRKSQDRLLQSIPRIHDLQAAWLLLLLLLFCAAPRANYLLRALPPHLTGGYVSMHAAAIARCVAALLDDGEGPLPQHSLRAAQLALRFGGLGLRSAQAERYAAHWASWCDTLTVVRARAPAVADRLLRALQGHIPLPCAAAAAHAREHLVAQGYDAPTWDMLASPHTAPAPRAPGDEPGDHLRGWQRQAARACDERACVTHLAELSPASRALLLSQAGPQAARSRMPPLGCDCESRPEVGRHGGCPLPASDADDNKAPAARTCQFRVRVVFCAARRCSRPIPAVCQLRGAAPQTASRATRWWHHRRAVTRATKAGHWQRPLRRAFSSSGHF